MWFNVTEMYSFNRENTHTHTHTHNVLVVILCFRDHDFQELVNTWKYVTS